MSAREVTMTSCSEAFLDTERVANRELNQYSYPNAFRKPIPKSFGPRRIVGTE